MQDHLKERLTGAAILVGVVVLLVPELFRGRPPADLKRDTGSAGGPPLRSYTIDLRDAAAGQARGDSAPVVSGPASTTSSVPASTTSSAPASSGAPAPVAVISAAPAPAAAPTSRPVTTAVASQRTDAAKAGWTVQVGSFARRDYAERMVKQVAAKGYTVVVAGPDDRGLYRVRSVPQPERAAAVALKQKMQASGFNPIVNTAP